MSTVTINNFLVTDGKAALHLLRCLAEVYQKPSEKVILSYEISKDVKDKYEADILRCLGFRDLSKSGKKSSGYLQLQLSHKTYWNWIASSNSSCIAPMHCVSYLLRLVIVQSLKGLIIFSFITYL